MFVRVASFEGGDTERMRDLAEERRASGSPMPDGMRRALVLADEDGGRRLFLAFFDSREQVEAAAAQFETMGDETPEEIRGRRTAVDVYEVVFDGTP